MSAFPTAKESLQKTEEKKADIERLAKQSKIVSRSNIIDCIQTANEGCETWCKVKFGYNDLQLTYGYAKMLAELAEELRDVNYEASLTCPCGTEAYMEIDWENAEGEDND